MTVSILDQLEQVTRKYSLNDGSQTISVDPTYLLNALRTVKEQAFTHLVTIIGFQEKKELVLKYPLSKVDVDEPTTTLFIETRIPLENPVISSAETVYPGASIYEREVMDLLGVQFQSRKPRQKLLLPDSWPKDVFPLRKTMTGLELRKFLDERKIGDEEISPLQEHADYTISVGPQHPTHKEPIRFQFFVKGEEIEDVALRLGFNHRGIEKGLESGEWIPNLYLIERICGICSAAHQLAYVEAAERLAGIVDEIPDKAKYLRVLVAELERVHSHMLWYGILAHDAGFDMMFHISWRDRELVMDMLEKLTGNRVNYSMMTIGGVRRDISNDLKTEILRELRTLRKRVEEHMSVMEKEQTFLARMKNVGVLSKHDALELCAVGPTIRGSGVNWDLRRDFPYAAYKSVPFKVYTRSEGDVLASMLVRLDETLESIDMCIYVLENLPSGEYRIKVPARLPEGEAHCRVEAPRGEDIHYLKSDGGKTPYRHKIRAPTLANMPSLLHRFKSMQIADIPMIIRLIDPCIGCMERVTFIDVKTSKTVELQGDELIAKANRKYRLGTSIQLFEV